MGFGLLGAVCGAILGLLVVLAISRSRGKLEIRSLSQPGFVQQLGRSRDVGSFLLLAAGFARALAGRSGQSLTARQAAALRGMLEQLVPGAESGPEVQAGAENEPYARLVEELVEEAAGLDSMLILLDPETIAPVLAKRCEPTWRAQNTDMSATNLALWAYHVAGAGEAGVSRQVLADILEFLRLAGVGDGEFLAQARQVWYPSLQALGTLGLEPGASWLSVRNRFRQLATASHPDKGGQASDEDFKLVSQAHELLRWQAELRV